MGRKEYSSWFRWTEERLRFLYENFASNSNQSIADALGCKKKCVIDKAHKLRLKKDNDYLVMAHAHAGIRYGIKGCNLSEDALSRRKQTRQKTVHIEKIRLKYGIHQRTNLKLKNIY
ncbi:MAG: hypothetical protein II859_10260 [Bacteroidales bacterium]|nr:hypothetical protein [Bacteroidales bacterium]